MIDNQPTEAMLATELEVWGGEFKPEGPVIRKWPTCKEPRRVRVTLGAFAIGVHVHVDIKEENNPYWDHKEGCWHKTFEDFESFGFFAIRRFRTTERAYDYVKEVYEERFSRGNYDVQINDMEATQYFYPREGD